MSVGWVLVAGMTLSSAPPPRPPRPCPIRAGLTIDERIPSPVPLLDDWQVLWGDVPISDWQLARLAADDVLSQELEQPLRQRGAWVYLGLVIAAAGTALSSTGWVLYGQDRLPQHLTLPLALGGILLGLGGMVVVTETIQGAFGPLTAPAPRHRLSRAQVRRLVVRVNDRLRRACLSTDGSASHEGLSPRDVASISGMDEAPEDDATE